jgi:hypothetical protein
MSIFEDTNPRLLSELLTEINSGLSVLPDFQRDFVWEPRATQDLIVSIANNYPAGSILRVRDSHNAFATREFEGAPAPNQIHTYLVLDGQQRLTSLYQAFYGAGEHQYFIRFDELLGGADFEDTIFYVKSNSKWFQKRKDNLEVQAKEMVFPLAVLMGRAGGYWNWSREIRKALTPDKRDEFEESAAKAYAHWLKPIEDYRFPVVTLSKDTEPDALCTIFETLNRTGVKLNVFELLTARFWPQNIRLRALWDKACEEYPVLIDFDVDPYYILQGISLASRESPTCKRRDVLELEPAAINAWWDRMVKGMAYGLEILQEDCKVTMPKWLPYQTMLAPLSAILAISDQAVGPAVGNIRSRVRRWIWCSVFGQSYERAPNTQSAKDVSEFKLWLQDGEEPESVRNFKFDTSELREVTPKQRALYRGTMCLVIGNGAGARDFHTGKPITRALIETEHIDDHHVFPDNFLKSQLGVTKRSDRDCILNRTLIDRTTNQVIQDKKPSEYLSAISHSSMDELRSTLKSHLLPDTADSSLFTDDYWKFIDDRLALISAEIMRVTSSH